MLRFVSKGETFRVENALCVGVSGTAFLDVVQSLQLLWCEVFFVDAIDYQALVLLGVEAPGVVVPGGWPTSGEPSRIHLLMAWGVVSQTSAASVMVISLASEACLVGTTSGGVPSACAIRAW